MQTNLNFQVAAMPVQQNFWGVRLFPIACPIAIFSSILTKSMFNPSQIMAVTGHKSVQSLTVYQRTDIVEKIAMGHAMGKSLTLPPQKKNSAVLEHLRY
jgi:hypothetical protein